MSNPCFRQTDRLQICLHPRLVIRGNHVGRRGRFMNVWGNSCFDSDHVPEVQVPKAGLKARGIAKTRKTGMRRGG